MLKSHPSCRRPAARNGFTLVELLIVIAIIGILSTLVVVLLADTRESARRNRTKAQIKKINELLMAKWEEYETRQLPMAIPREIDFGGGPQLLQQKHVAFLRLMALRDLMRMEMPDRISDIRSNIDEADGDPTVNTVLDFSPVNLPIFIDTDGVGGQPERLTLSGRSIRSPSVLRRYVRQIDNQVGDVSNWSIPFQGSECLYLILASIQDEAGSGLDFFRNSEIGDVDGDGMKEILDAWGNPIIFLRWAPGFESPIQPRDGERFPDPMDPFKVDLHWQLPAPAPFEVPYALLPYVYSAGPDGLYDTAVNVDTDPTVDSPDDPDTDPQNDPLVYATLLLPTSLGGIPSTTPLYPNNPYYVRDGDGAQIGRRNTDASGATAATDDIDNHIGLEN